LSTFTDVSSSHGLSLYSERHMLVTDYDNDHILLLNSELQLLLPLQFVRWDCF